MTTTYQPPTHEALEEQARDFLKANRPKEYRELKQAGNLQEYCHQKADAAARLAENLGAPARVSWPRAIRQEILEVESD